MTEAKVVLTAGSMTRTYVVTKPHWGSFVEWIAHDIKALNCVYDCWSFAFTLFLRLDIFLENRLWSATYAKDLYNQKVKYYASNIDI